MGVGDFFPPLTVAVGDAVADGLALGEGDGLGALSAGDAVARSAPQRPTSPRRRSFFMSLIAPGGKAHHTGFWKECQQNFQNYPKNLFTPAYAKATAWQGGLRIEDGG